MALLLSIMTFLIVVAIVALIWMFMGITPPLAGATCRAGRSMAMPSSPACMFSHP